MQHQQSEREAIERLAYKLWEDRGGPSGSPDEDWFRAEAELKAEDALVFSTAMNPGEE